MSRADTHNHKGCNWLLHLHLCMDSGTTLSSPHGPTALLVMPFAIKAGLVEAWLAVPLSRKVEIARSQIISLKLDVHGNYLLVQDGKKPFSVGFMPDSTRKVQ